VVRITTLSLQLNHIFPLPSTPKLKLETGVSGQNP
jgi:hypothetical protein